MKLGILLSGGKDSLYAAYKAKGAGHELSCCLTITSTNSESYMFHTPNIAGVDLQAEAMQLPLIVQETKGEKEVELEDLKLLITQAKDKYGIQGITTGAVGSQYQASRIQRICFELDLYCFNPLWQLDQVCLLEELLKHHFEVIFTGVAAYPLTEKWLGRTIDAPCISELVGLQKKFHINPAGEGGELESYVLDCPLFTKRIQINATEQEFEHNAGTYTITDAKLVKKEQENVKPLLSVQTAENADVLLISCVSESLTLHEEEFIKPLILASQKKCHVVSLNRIPETISEKHIIISGCGLGDDKFLKHKEQLKTIHKLNKPVLGICAGAELLLPEEHELKEILEIGPQEIEELHKHPLTTELDSKEVYFLHHLGLNAIPFTSNLTGLLASKKGIAAFKYANTNIFGVQFHPEVSQKDLIKEFLKL